MNSFFATILLDASEVEISRGEGRTYLQFGRSGEEIVVRATAASLEPASLTISTRR